ncbi:molybdopterin molybdotransferase MoeA [Erythrobacter sp. JK5]|uniref:molybdopterin molybdotransferase MoeA n=1 Tax=Erythrobacter sp. JK5 TaxID=2829500 RepID=UPI001BA6DBBC|nr:molybdopterin molybdotransferase MoeA [Erythrobacter sp. JK5]QUL39345.1 molybdopterin molybdotransferase MoeA [Erythrobacter sp. JK5]
MLTLEEAQARLLALDPAQEAIEIECQSALGRYLSRDLTALRTQPAADLSAMDGYAVCGDGPWQRVGESRAGMPFAGSLAPGQCTRISTGAHMPTGSDRVLIQENAKADSNLIALAEGEDPPPPGRHVRKAGFDFGRGDTVLAKGTRLGPAQLALAIAAGHDTVPIVKPATVQVLDSGDELARPGSQCGADQIPASNGTMIAAMLAPHVGSVQLLGPVPDDLPALAAALEKADHPILVTSGGASVGDHDLIQRALIDWGAELAFWKVAIKPGKPLMVATRRRESGIQVIVGLPGNPVSSFVTCFLFVLPLVRAVAGVSDPLPKAETRIASEDLPAVGSRREFLRAVSDGARVRLAASQDSSALLALAAANCLIDRPAGAPAVSAGEPVPVYMLQNG